jgi:radical SAM superfamily enzyme YgiQ (UPF0313 family)
VKILLIHPKWTDEYGLFAHFAKKASTCPPLNLAYLGAIAENSGHNVRIIDGEAERISIDDMVNKIVDFSPDLIGISATTPFYHLAMNLATQIKKTNNNFPVVIGGPHVTVLKEKAFNDCFDFAFIGEADRSWPLFLDSYEKNGDVSNVKGILYRENGNVKYTGQSESIYDVDSLPLPARHLLKNDKYKMGTLMGSMKFTTIMTMRGCPFKCIFCSTEVFGKDIRRRSPERVVNEMKECLERYGTKHFLFLDGTLTLNRKHISDICDLVQKENLNITFEGGTRADLVDEELIEKMAKSGLVRLFLGLETVDDNIRKTIKKMVPVKSYVVANRLANKYGIETINACIIGLPGETKDTVKKTLSFLRDAREIKQAHISIAIPYPGTELSDMAKNGDYNLKLISDDFSKFRRYNSAVMSVGDFSPDDLIKLQNDAFVSVYLAPWRWKSMYKKSGIIGCFLTFVRLIKSIIRGRFDLLVVDRNYWKTSISE